jgi:hypothetical protein
MMIASAARVSKVPKAGVARVRQIWDKALVARQFVLFPGAPAA